MKNTANFFPKIFLSALSLLCLPGMAAETNEFFAMDTIARGRPAEVVPLLKELGYPDSVARSVTAKWRWR